MLQSVPRLGIMIPLALILGQEDIKRESVKHF